MIAISDTSPLLYLVWIEKAWILPELFSKVLIPPAVGVELQHAKTPALVRDWINKPPIWLEIQPPKNVLEIPKLGPGELSAISLALETAPSHLLMDDRDAITVARQHGVKITGTLGVLLVAAQQQRLSLDDAIAELRATTFRMPESLLPALLSSVEIKPTET